MLHSIFYNNIKVCKYETYLCVAELLGFVWVINTAR